MIVKLVEVTGTESVSGETNGLTAMLTVARSIPQDSKEPRVFVDFSGIGIATGSFLRAFTIGLRDFCNEHRPGVSVILANVNDTVREELVDRLRVMREAVVTCKLSAKGSVSAPQVVGVLEEKQMETLRAVNERGEVDAPMLAARDSESDASANKWNNRLALLASKGILKERREGRIKRYSPVLEGLTYGS